MVKTTNVYFSAFQFRRVLLSVALFILSTLSFQLSAEQSSFLNRLDSFQRLQEQGDINSPVQWLTTKQEDILANPFLQQGIPDAIPIYEQILVFAKIMWGAEHYRIARGLNFLAELHRSQGDYDNAKRSLLEALRFMEKKYPTHFDTAAISNNLGRIYATMGNYPEAEHYLLKALKIAEKSKALGPKHPNTAAGQQNLAAVYSIVGKYAKANELYEQALATLEKTLGPTHYQTVVLRQNMAAFYAELGNYAEGERLLSEVIKIADKKRFLEIRGTARSHLANLYYSKHHNDKAQRYTNDKKRQLIKAKDLYKDTLEIYRTFLGPKNPHIISAFGDLAVIYYEMGDYANAEHWFRKTAEMCQQWLGPEAVETAASLHNLGMFYHFKGDFDEAEKLLQQALHIFQNPKKSSAEQQIIYPFIFGIMKNLAVVYSDKGQSKKARFYARKALALEKEKRLQQVLSFGSEPQWLAFQQQSYPYDLIAKVGDATLLAEAVIQNKGIVLDALMEDQLIERAEKHPQKKIVIDRVKSTIGKLTKLPETISEKYPEEQKAKLSSEKAALEKQLATQLKDAASILTPQEVAALTPGRWALSVKLSEVQSVLPKNSVLVEFIRYELHVKRQKLESHYGAVLIPNQGEPTWVPLGKADVIEKNILKYQSFFRCDREKQNCNRDEKAFKQLLRSLYQQIWTPIENQLKGVTTVILSPDGELNFLSFATLLSPKKKREFLVKKFDLYYAAYH
jgi:tetratricopeptide (TPR) repeat protein